MRAISLLVLIIATTSVFGGQDCSELIASFKTPPRSCTQVPFWFWNGPLDSEELAGQLHEVAAKGVYGAMPLPRFGMDRRRYLEKPYWDAFSAVVKEAVALDMKIWLYDEW